MKYYMAQSDIRDGDYEYQSFYILSSKTDLPDTATAQLTAWNYGLELNLDDTGFQWCGERLVRESIRSEINPEHIDVLKNYLPMISWQFIKQNGDES